jgi:hypothetical protein
MKNITQVKATTKNFFWRDIQTIIKIIEWTFPKLHLQYKTHRHRKVDHKCKLEFLLTQYLILLLLAKCKKSVKRIDNIF